MGKEPSALRLLLGYVAPYWRRLVPVLLLSLLGTLLSLFIPYLSKLLVDSAFLGGDMGALVRIVGAFVAITLVSFALNVISGMRYTRVSADVLFDMRRELYVHLQSLSLRFYSETSLGEIVSRINSDISEIQRVASETALAPIGNVLFLIGTVVMLAWLDARLFAVSLVMVPPSLWALIHYRRRLEVSVAQLRRNSTDIGTFLIETIQGMKLVVASNAQGREVERFGRKNDTFVESLMSMRLLTYLSGGFPGLILSGGTAIVFLYGGARLMGLWANFATAKVSLGRVHEILDVEPEVSERPDPVALPVVHGSVTFEGVTFTFGRGGCVLEDVSFQVGPGEILAVVGASGSGKSTIADLLARHFDPDAGCISLDGVDLKDISLTDLRRQIVTVNQEPFVFHASIAENILYARPEASPNDVAEVARAAGLDDFLSGLPQGLDTTVGERGLAMSAGERQRIAIARALLADPAILVLDEATAALDPATQAEVIRGYEAAMRNRTTILISHRLELVERADRVVVIEGSRVVQEGTPQELREVRGAFLELFGARADVRTAGHVKAPQ